MRLMPSTEMWTALCWLSFVARLLYLENSGIASCLEMLYLFGLAVVSAETVTHSLCRVS